MNKERSAYDCDFALVEYVDGGDLSTFFSSERSIQDRVFGQFKEQLKQMHHIRRKTWGKAGVDIDAYSEPCHIAVY